MVPCLSWHISNDSGDNENDNSDDDNGDDDAEEIDCVLNTVAVKR